MPVVIKALIVFLTLLPTTSSVTSHQNAYPQRQRQRVPRRSSSSRVHNLESQRERWKNSDNTKLSVEEALRASPGHDQLSGSDGSLYTGVQEHSSESTSLSLCRTACKTPKKAARSRGDQPQILFLHMQKCGGTTIEGSLQRMAQKARPQLSYARLTISQLKKIHVPHTLDQKQQTKMQKAFNVDIVAGHLFNGVHRYLKPPHDGRNHPRDQIYFTMLRHPVDRVISHFYDNGRKCSKDIREFAMKCSGLNYYYNRILEHDALPAAPGKSRVRPADGEQLEEVKRIMEMKFVTVGIMEHFQHSMVLLGRALQNLLPVPFTFCREQRKHSTPSVDAETRRWLEEKLWVDMEIYKHGLKLFKRQKECCFDGSFRRELDAFRLQQESYNRTVCSV